MKIICIALILTVSVINKKVDCGGYLGQGGVMDFHKPLDFMPMAVMAGKMASGELKSNAESTDREQRHASSYIPTFYSKAGESQRSFGRQWRGIRKFEFPYMYVR